MRITGEFEPITLSAEPLVGLSPYVSLNLPSQYYINLEIMDEPRNNNQRTDWSWIEALPTSALVISSDRTILAANTACEDEFNYAYARDQPVGSTADFLVPAYAWPPPSGGLTLSLAAETASGAINPVDVFLSPASFGTDGTTDKPGAYLAMVEGVEYESDGSAEENKSTVRELLSDIGAIVSSSLDIQSVCEQFSMAVMQSVPTERVAICATNHGSDQHHIIHAVPAAPGSPQRKTPLQNWMPDPPWPTGPVPINRPTL